MTNDENTMHVQQHALTDEAEQGSSARLSRAGFLKVVTATALGAAGTLMYAGQSLAAPVAKQSGVVTQDKKTRSGLYYIKSSLTGLVLDIPDANRAVGTLVTVAPINSPLTYNQLWFVSEDGYIQSLLNGYVLDVVGAKTSLRTLVDVFPRNFPPSPNQHWLFSDGYIYTSLDGMVLDVSESNTASGATVIVFSKNSPRSSNQQWTLVPAF